MKPGRTRDQPCNYPGCQELVRRSSHYCRHHLGVVHGTASARTFACPATCQALHVRCPRCNVLCNGSHARRLREGLCYQAGVPSCWSQLHQDGGGLLDVWTVTCLICSRSYEVLTAPPRDLRCEQCGSQLLEAEHVRITARGVRP